jgi:hypothetical protein
MYIKTQERKKESVTNSSQNFLILISRLHTIIVVCESDNIQANQDLVWNFSRCFIQFME